PSWYRRRANTRPADSRASGEATASLARSSGYSMSGDGSVLLSDGREIAAYGLRKKQGRDDRARDSDDPHDHHRDAQRRERGDQGDALDEDERRGSSEVVSQRLSVRAYLGREQLREVRTERRVDPELEEPVDDAGRQQRPCRAAERRVEIERNRE